MDVALRGYSTTDQTACVEVLASNVPEYAVTSELAQYGRFLERLDEWKCRYIVGERARQVIACAGLAVDPTTGVATFCWGLVARPYHRRGIGTRLTLERLSWIVDDPRVTRVELDTSQRTAGFFARFGFVEARVTPDGYAPGLHRHDMVLAFDASARAALRSQLASAARRVGEA